MAKGPLPAKDGGPLAPVNVHSADGGRNCCPGRWNVHSKESRNRRVCHFLRDTDAEERRFLPSPETARGRRRPCRQKAARRGSRTRRGPRLISLGGINYVKTEIEERGG